ncbi:tetratricopeptide repeat-containing serine protease family protein (plasmid) [Nostoc sp. UHCC 0302]|uniref:tetratricopeptide repeat-containing S1 family peptidase n=1 Tax=Nostoc sp. UHCC 0302 TaxID=3134896 RepID=UPI00311CDC52
MKFYYSLTPALIGVSIAFVQPQNAFALSSAEVAKVAKAITVEISNPNGSGTGVIIKREGNNYTILTAKHVVEAQAKYEIVTPDGARYSLNYSTVKKLPQVDLAVVQFASNQNYPVAKIGNSDSSTEGTTAYVAGFPQISAAISSSIYNFTNGQITANASKPLRDGYALVYSNDTLAGMSGGPVLNDQGELIGIHGRSDTTENFKISDKNPNVIIKTGFNLGIPINTFLRLSAKTGADVGVSAPNTRTATAPKADDFYIQAGDKYKKGDLQGALADLNQAIKINPNFANAYNNRGVVRDELGDKQGAITDLNQAIKINPNFANAYNNRGNTHALLGDKQRAIADYNQAIKINPNLADAYNNRGLARAQLGDKQGAIEDYNQAIKINPNLALAYNNRGAIRFELGDKQAAITDYNQAIKINPNFAYAYKNRGTARDELGDKQGAIEDFNQAIKINPNYANAYFNRGFLRANLGDKQGAIADYQKAANLFQEQGDTNSYLDLMGWIKELQQ